MERHLGAQVKHPQNDNTKFSISCVWNTLAHLALPLIPAELMLISSKLLSQIASEAKQPGSETQGGANYKLTMHRIG